jgi:hypothetical protein
VSRPNDPVGALRGPGPGPSSHVSRYAARVSTITQPARSFAADGGCTLQITANGPQGTRLSQRRLAMGQQPEDRLDEDLEIDSETAENVTGGFRIAFESKNVDAKKEPGVHVDPGMERF